MVEKAETIQVHFTVEGEGLWPKEIIMDEKSTWIPTYMVDYE